MDDYAVWSIPPDWTNGVTETLEYLTAINISVDGHEQRRGLRHRPRQMIEYNYILNGPHRTYFDLLTLRAAGSPLYVPLWYEPVPLKLDATIGDTVVWCDTIYTELFAAKYCFIRGPQPWDYEVKEIFGISFYGVSFETGLEKEWKKGTFVYPMRLCRVESQARSTHRTHLVMQATVRFESIDLATPPILPELVPSYLNHYALEINPNEAENLQYDYSRLNLVLDNTFGLPALYDYMGTTTQQFHWWAKGRKNQHSLRNLFHVLDGRRKPIWIPTFYRDFEPLWFASDTMAVKYCGFTETGGPFASRDHIVFEFYVGGRLYCEILESAIAGDNEYERILLDTNMTGVEVSNVKRVSFVALSRLDQDTVELLHHTETGGLTTATTVFRAASLADILTYEQGVGDDAPPLFELTCQHTLEWNYGTLSTDCMLNRKMPERLDKYGNQYYTNYEKVLYVNDKDGILQTTITMQDMVDMINSWYGSTILPSHANSPYSIVGGPVLFGEYVLVHIRAYNSGQNFVYWWVLLTPAADATLSVISAVRYLGLLDPPYVNGAQIIGANDADDPLLVGAYYAIGGSMFTLLVLPSVNEFLSETYRGGLGSLGPCTIPPVIRHPFGGTANLANNFFCEAGVNESHNFCFLLPSSSGIDLYVYIGTRTMTYAITPPPPGFIDTPCLELRNVIQPSNPTGAILKVGLGSYKFADLAVMPLGSHYRGLATSLYTVDNENWKFEDGSWAIPFSDESTYIETGEAGGDDSYSPQVVTMKRSNGRYWIIFHMHGIFDYHVRLAAQEQANPSVWATMRLFEYDPATGSKTQLMQASCTVHDSVEVNPATVNNFDFHQIYEFVQVGQLITVYIRILNFKVRFGEFYAPA